MRSRKLLGANQVRVVEGLTCSYKGSGGPFR